MSKKFYKERMEELAKLEKQEEELERLKLEEELLKKKNSEPPKLTEEEMLYLLNKMDVVLYVGHINLILIEN